MSRVTVKVIEKVIFIFIQRENNQRRKVLSTTNKCYDLYKARINKGSVAAKQL